jgi:cytochrome b561
MNLRSTEHQWGAVAKFFHWLMALAILGNGIFGLCMDLASSPMQKIGWFAWHKSIGLTVLALFLLRLMWRFADRRPRDEPGPRWQHLAAHAVHGVLYVLILAMPLSGWWFNSLRGFPLQYFKQFNLPAIAEKNEELAQTVLAFHEYLFYILLLVLVAHAGAALKHHLFDNDNVLRRMLPFGKLRDTSSQGDS